ncbi:hypothetical protein H310_08461 [Aphanomyces invadans]|uniref:Chromo domain-containing protein n=1 Tax=Aphanomyces invadans TaxID=157072 RepID=A0A024TYA7_9STRA|nr:hypothetical protein H310_08461 [Aphanomyces invadans]ETV98988.1 hypothetical protein H310_08461 [Aphanomyces invadans]|eukprot:XP_008872416.1 hypothetical protein H310_08461 [Aphanomyces invadans]
MAWTSSTREAHSSRLKFYADDSLEVSEELLRHVAHNADGHVVDEFLDCRYNDRLPAYELLASWLGLQDIENSWEPASNRRPAAHIQQAVTRSTFGCEAPVATSTWKKASVSGIVLNMMRTGKWTGGRT